MSTQPDEFELARHPDDNVWHALELARAGGRPHEEGSTEKERVLQLIRIIQRDLYERGRMSVQQAIRQALGIK